VAYILAFGITPGDIEGWRYEDSADLIGRPTQALLDQLAAAWHDPVVRREVTRLVAEAQPGGRPFGAFLFDGERRPTPEDYVAAVDACGAAWGNDEQDE